MDGIVAFFDILGYQSFLENNSATETALKVLDLINELPKLTSRSVSDFWINHEAAHGAAVIKMPEHCSHLIFSDSIVLTIPFEENATQFWKDMALNYLLTMAAHLQARMFQAGLPLRGGIVRGDFLVKGTCLAGQAIIDAYRLCESLDFSGVVFSPDLGTYIEKRQKDTDPLIEPSVYDTFFVRYLSPLKNSQEKHLLHLNWIAFMGKTKEKFTSDIASSVLRAFWAHKKDCPRAVDSKVLNTTKLVHRLTMATDDSTKLTTPPTSSAPRP